VFGHRDIGDPGDKVFGHFGIAKSETPTRRKVSFKGSAVSVAKSRDSRNQESHGHMHFGIGNPETPTRDKTRSGIRHMNQSLAKRANA
jgi:hypothetical protein